MALHICISHVAQTFRTFRTFGKHFILSVLFRFTKWFVKSIRCMILCQMKLRVSNNNISLNQWCLTKSQALQNAPIGYCSPSFQICDWSKIFRNLVFELFTHNAPSSQATEGNIYIFKTHHFKGREKIHRNINIFECFLRPLLFSVSKWEFTDFYFHTKFGILELEPSVCYQYFKVKMYLLSETI